ncbi:acyltransferase [Nitrobacter sp. Nb-311A]|uniref:acyltransferase family protein n=1 Tax=Nitrobacter sp. Nb-311A TaxID=314253 RepID=UPI000A006D39|nr:acyltransferase [Nitrobacter sp. Nb-311A]
MRPDIIDGFKNSVMSETRTSMLSVQYLRAFAALLVVWFHASSQWSRISGVPVSFPESGGQYGVDIFFVVSGFIMWITTSETTSPVTFLYRRFTRIVPLYWLATSILILIAYVAPQLLSTTKIDLFHTTTSFLFLPWHHPVTGSIAPLIIPGWTLNYEMTFYLLFAFCLLLPRTWLPIAVTTILTALVTIGAIFRFSSAAGIFYTNNIVLEFAIGVAVGQWFSREGSSFWLSISILVGCLILINFQILQLSHLSRSVKIGLPAALILFGCVFAELTFSAPRCRVLLFLGAASYSVYLTHFATLPIVRKFWLAVGYSEVSFGWVFILVSVIFSTVGGLICYLLIEKPLLALFRQSRVRAHNQ